jgi:hypothetical protein
MTPFDVPPDEMGIDPEIANEELEALLAGQGRDKNLDLTRFVDDLSTAFPASAPAAAAHLAAIANEAQLLADKGDPVARPASNAVAPVPQASRPPKRWRNTMKDKKARVLIKIAAPVVALFAVLGIMGSAGALPRTLQHLTSHAAGFVGLDLPSGDDEGNDSTADDQGDQNDQGDVKDATDQGDQNDQGDATGSTDTSDQGDQNDQGDSTSSDSTDQGDQNDQGDSTGSTDTSDQGDQNDQGDATGSSGGSSDQGDQNDQGDSTGGSSGGSSENDQGDGGSSQDNQGDSNDGGSSDSSGSGSSGSGSGSGDNQD